MEPEVPPTPRQPDRRVRRSRAALMRAAVELVTARGTAAVPVSDIAEAADLSRQVLYQQFGDRDTLLLEATLDLVRTDLVPRVRAIGPAPAGRAHSVAVAGHFADHRGFYRAVLTGPSAFVINRALAGLLVPLNRQVIRERLGDHIGDRTADDLATFVTGGGTAFVTAWIGGDEQTLDPEEFADRLSRLFAVVADVVHQAPPPPSPTAD